MALSPYTIERFGALNLVDDPLEVGTSGAVDLVNVDFDKRGRVRCRNGFARVAAITMTGVTYGLAAYDPFFSPKQVIVGYEDAVSTPKYAVYTTAGVVVVAATTVGGAFISSARIGTPSAEYLYLANGVDTIRRWNGSAFTSPGGMPIATHLAVMPTSGRLVAAPIPGTSLSRVKFSDAGAAETWGANNFVDLVPGDGFITTLQVWQNLLFVFKNNRFFVFYGESVDADGEPIFNFKTVQGYGALVATSGEEGVYFSDGRTIWLTTNDIPRRVSEPIEPFLRGEVSLNGETVDQAEILGWDLSYSIGRLYLSLTTSGAVRRTLVLDPKTNTWTYYSLGVRSARQLRMATAEKLQTFWLSSAGIETFSGVTTDNSAAITWSYKSGKYPLSDPVQVAITQESRMVGIGTVALRLDTELYSNVNGSVTLGTSPTEAEGWLQKDQEGQLFQHTFSGSGPASVSQLSHLVRSVKPVGLG